MVQWKGRRQSDRIDDRRGVSTPAKAGIGLGGLAMVVVFMLLGGDPQLLLGVLEQQGSPSTSARKAPSAAQDAPSQFISVMLADTEDVWGQVFEKKGARYAEPTLVLFRDQVQSACGGASSAMGPFYCPGDRQVYIDLSFFDELARRFGAPGDFAQAYVLAHEVGHHVQTLVGTSDQVRKAQAGASTTEANRLSVLLELQADCYAGLWAHHAQRTKQILEPGDIEEGLRAATAIGDDTLQKQATGRVVPESFTHGSSAQRVQWFTTGFEQGTMEACNTFVKAR